MPNHQDGSYPGSKTKVCSQGHPSSQWWGAHPSAGPRRAADLSLDPFRPPAGPMADRPHLSLARRSTDRRTSLLLTDFD